MNFPLLPKRAAKISIFFFPANFISIFLKKFCKQLCAESGELPHIQLMVLAMLLQKALMRTCFHYMALVHHYYHIGILDSREPVRNDYAGAVGHDSGHRILDIFFGPGINI